MLSSKTMPNILGKKQHCICWVSPSC